VKEIFVCIGIVFGFGAICGAFVLGYQAIVHAPETIVNVLHWLAG
jgi:hypothetical protein